MTPPSARLGPNLAFLGVLAVAFSLRAYHIGDDCFDCDELYAVRIQGVTPKAVAAVMARDGFHTNHPPLMTVPFLAWNAVFGTSEAAVRGLPLLAGVVAVAVVFAFGCVLGRPWAGVFGAALLAINPLHIIYSAEARQYALVTALLAVAHVLFVLALRRPARGYVLAYYLVAAWAALTHYFAVPVLLGHTAAATWLLCKPGPTRLPAARLFLAVGLAGLPYLAWLPVIRFQTHMKWDHLTPLTPGSLIDSLTELFGLGGWGTAIGLGLSLAALGLAAFGVWAAWRIAVPAARAVKPLLPAWLGWFVLAIGLLGGAGFAFAFPRMIEPTARETLSSYGYDAAIVNEEVGLLRQTGLLGAGCVVLAGVVLVVWQRVEIKCNPANESPPTAVGGTASAGLLLTFFLLVPVAVIALGGLTGIPFHQTRNLLVMLPAVCLAWGFGLERFSRSVLGMIVASVVVLGMIFAAGQYHAVGRIVGRDGPRLGIDTIDWRGVRAWLAEQRAERTVVLVDRPATDPALYYLAAFNPVRMPADTVPVDLPARIVFVHLVGNTFSERAREKLIEARPLVKLAAGDGWEVYAISDP
jgi:Dolichyl-phosphate-mannose-protein mannosyltransferase